MGFVVCGGNGSELIFVAVMADPSRLPALHKALASDAPNTCGLVVNCVPPDHLVLKLRYFSDFRYLCVSSSAAETEVN